MPGSYPSIMGAIETLYKVFSQTYVDSKKEGEMKLFVCDFLQDENGRFHFLKVCDFEKDEKPSFQRDWVSSQKYLLKQERHL